MLHTFKKRPSRNLFRTCEKSSIAVVCAWGVLGGAAASGQELVEVTNSELVRNHSRLLRLGPFDVTPAIGTGAVYDDNISLSSTKPVGDVVWSIMPSVSAMAGENGSPNIKLEYKPTALFFTQHSNFNSVDELADLRAVYPFARLTLDVTQNYLAASGGVVDVGNRVARQVYTTVLNSKYELSQKTSFEIDGRQEISNYERLISSREWENFDWFNYELTPKITTSTGATLGYLESQGNPAQTYEQILVRAAYQAAEKLDVSVSAGEEIRQVRGRTGNFFSPVFAVIGTYTPAFSTKLTLEARRKEQNSAAFSGQNFTSTGFLATVTRRTWERYLLSLSVGYDNYDYQSITSTVNVNRSDNVASIRAGIDVAFNAHVSVGISYLYRRDDSSSTFSFVNNQISVVASVAY